VLGFCEIANLRTLLGGEFEILASLTNSRGIQLALVRKGLEKKLFVLPIRPEFDGIPFRGGLLCSLTWQNAKAMLSLFPEFHPKRVPMKPSFGFGDRLGLATPGHVRALKEAEVFPIFAQQSMRENARTGRTFADVLADAVYGAFQGGWTWGFGADADHLKSVEEARKAAQLGYSFFTCDPSEFLVPVERLSERELSHRSQELPLTELEKEYLGRTFFLPGLGKLAFSKEELLRIAVKYWRALSFAEEMYRALAKELPQGFDFELSVDEAGEPTTANEHLFLVLELRRREVKLTSLAPRFPGTMEKAVDYGGNLEEFRRALKAHVAIAKFFGPYRISLHSGSDKWSLYPILAQEAEGRWHVKTAGTSYLLALEVLAHVSPVLFREILILSYERFPFDRQSYHVSAKPPELQMVLEMESSRLFRDHSIRQMLHVTFGSVLQKYGEDIRRELLAHEEEYHSALAQYLGRHLEALGVKGDV